MYTLRTREIVILILNHINDDQNVNETNINEYNECLAVSAWSHSSSGMIFMRCRAAKLPALITFDIDFDVILFEMQQSEMNFAALKAFLW